MPKPKDRVVAAPAAASKRHVTPAKASTPAKVTSVAKVAPTPVKAKVAPAKKAPAAKVVAKPGKAVKSAPKKDLPAKTKKSASPAKPKVASATPAKAKKNGAEVAKVTVAAKPKSVPVVKPIKAVKSPGSGDATPLDRKPDSKATPKAVKSPTIKPVVPAKTAAVAKPASGSQSRAKQEPRMESENPAVAKPVPVSTVVLQEKREPNTTAKANPARREAKPAPVLKPVAIPSSAHRAQSKVSTMSKDHAESGKHRVDRAQLACPFAGEELKAWRQLLATRRAEISSDIDALEKDAMEAEDGHTTPLHAAERGSDADLQDISLGLAGEEKGLLWQIERALRKIDLNRPIPFGLCEHTLQPIPKQRLQLIPWTPLSIEGATYMEEARLTIEDILIDD